MSPSLDLLVSFVEIAEAGSLAKAAARSGIPTSTLSRNLARLEAELGRRLVQRSTRALSLSEDGQSLYQRSAGLLRHLREELEAAAHADREPRGLLRLTAPSGFGRVVLAPLIAEFMQRHPLVEVEVLLADQRLNLIEDGIDLAFRMGRLEDSSLMARRIGTIERVLCASPAYLDARGRPQTPQDLRGHAYLALQRDQQTIAMQSVQGREVAVTLRPRLVCAPADALLPSLLAGLGVAWVPGFHVHELIQAGTLERLLPAWRLPEAAISLVYASARGMPGRLSAFIAFVEQRMGQDPRFQRHGGALP